MGAESSSTLGSAASASSTNNVIIGAVVGKQIVSKRESLIRVVGCVGLALIVVVVVMRRRRLQSSQQEPEKTPQPFGAVNSVI